MTTIDRNAAWAALADPATDAAALATIAGTYPEFSAAIGQHPNAYPALVDWAQGAAAAQAPQSAPLQNSSPYSVAGSEGQRLGSPDVAAARAARNRTLWIIALVIYEVVPIVQVAAQDVLGGLNTDPSSFVGAMVSWWPLLAFPVVAVIGAPTTARKVLGLACGVGAFVVECAAQSIQYGAFGGQGPVPVQILFVGASASLLFLTWAIARPLAPAGYAALPLTIAVMGVFRIAVVPWIWSSVIDPLTKDHHLTATVSDLIGSVLYAAIESAVIIGIVLLASMWSRRSEERSALLSKSVS